MFTKDELQWLYMAANSVPTPANTALGKFKAHMIFKLCTELDAQDKETEASTDTGKDEDLI